ncbi:MAG: twin-arginine translocase TatA/TatE family subunit [Chloroflexi bacterium]|nr:twin-arginine translocase TatA/TatE family subunit [Chloroflexota bacterium]
MDLALILVVVLVLALMWRGPKMLPKLGEAFGKGVKDARDEFAKQTDTDPEQRPPQP